MRDYDRGFKAAAHTSGRELARLANLSCTRWAPIISEMQFSERFADRAFSARRGRERFVVYFEAYTTWDDDARWNMLAKSGLLSERERAPTKCLVFILQQVWVGVVLSVPLALFISGIEILVVLLQAYIFTMLTSLFIGMSVHPQH